MLSQIEKDGLCYLSATEVIARYRAGSLLPSILINALIKRIEEVNPAINALADTYFDEALEQAAAADILYVEVPPSDYSPSVDQKSPSFVIWLRPPSAPFSLHCWLAIRDR